MKKFHVVTAKKSLLFRRLLVTLIFGISYRQQPLYSSNQNTYFLHGLVGGGLSSLKTDWLAQTADMFPAFSILVNITLQMFGENIFYLIYVVILGIYAHSTFGIVSCVYDISDSNVKYFFYFVMLTMLYSGLLASYLSKLPVLWHFASIVDPNGLLTGGVAKQYILGSVLQPSTFGVFIVLSIYSFLRDKPFMAAVYLAIATTFHLTYLLSSTILMCIYMTTGFVREKDYRKVSLIGMIFLVLIVPILTYTYLNFNSTTASMTHQAQDILTNYRIPHHAKPVNWFGKSTLFQIAVVVLGIYLVRHTILLPVLLVLLLSGTILTIVQIFTRSEGLALLFPWRISVFLVPIASSVILASIVPFIFHVLNKSISKNTRIYQVATLIVIMIIGYWGVRNLITLHNAPKVGLTPSAKFVTSTFQPGNIYLIPPDLESFRIAARVPVFIDFKSHPYRDIEIIEWFDRIKIANDFYAARAEVACNILRNIYGKYAITHVVLRNAFSITNCEILHELYKDSEFVVYRVVP